MTGVSDANNFCIDQRGLKTIIQTEVADFLQPHQVSSNSVVTSAEYSGDGTTLASSCPPFLLAFWNMAMRVQVCRSLTKGRGYSTHGHASKACTASPVQLQRTSMKQLASIMKSTGCAVRTYQRLTITQNNNFTFDTDMGGFSDENNVCIDQRGFKTIIQAEAAEFLQPEQVSLTSVVTTIEYGRDVVTVTLADGTTLTADYVLCTSSLGVLQYGDVAFEPALPSWKMEAIQSMVMATYTKVFLQIENKFWFNTEMATYADKEWGRYPIWQNLGHVNFPSSRLVFVTLTGDFSLRIEGMEDSDVQEEVVEILRATTTLPDPITFHSKRWHVDPLFRGSYSNWPPFLTGHRKSEGFGFLHGAYFEGLNAEEEIASTDSVFEHWFKDKVRIRVGTNIGVPPSWPSTWVTPFTRWHGGTFTRNP
ncbi:flavin-containing amine oxidoreductase-domain containing protein [Suillus lakei]|nr:flavin-containing amine oxidoreductase-domain containing protein [Suillus lakei]